MSAELPLILCPSEMTTQTSYVHHFFVVGVQSIHVEPDTLPAHRHFTTATIDASIK